MVPPSTLPLYSLPCRVYWSYFLPMLEGGATEDRLAGYDFAGGGDSTARESASSDFPVADVMTRLLGTIV